MARRPTGRGVVEAARRITGSIDVPLKVDAGAGYGDPLHVTRTVRELERAGVAAMHFEDQVFPIDPKKPDPGRVTIRRLNRTEYNNTIRDLVGVEFRPADDFPIDDVGYGFDNIGDVLTVSPVLSVSCGNFASAVESAAYASCGAADNRAERDSSRSPCSSSTCSCCR